MIKIKNILIKNKLTVALTLIGLVGGYVYWNFWGCTDGCPIRSNASMMTVYGGLIGGLFGNMFQGFGKKKENKENK